MSLALGTIILFFVFITPGMLFRRFYYTLEFSKQFIKNTSFKVFISSIIIGSFIQIVFYYYLVHKNNWVTYDVDFKLLGSLLFGDKKTLSSNLVIVSNQAGLIIIYFLCLSIFSIFLGYLSSFFVRKLKWDVKTRIFRFNNQWYYLFKGEILEFPDVRRRLNSKDFNNIDVDENENENENETKDTKRAVNINLAYIDAIVETGDRVTLYKGILLDYYLNHNGDSLEYIYLTAAKRKLLYRNDNISYEINSDNTQEQPLVVNNWNRFESDIFIIPFEKIINLNIRYIYILPYSIARIMNAHLKKKQDGEDWETITVGKDSKKDIWLLHKYNFIDYDRIIKYKPSFDFKWNKHRWLRSHVSLILYEKYYKSTINRECSLFDNILADDFFHIND